MLYDYIDIARQISASKSIIAHTGMGISEGSGIPNFFSEVTDYNDPDYYYESCWKVLADAFRYSVFSNIPENFFHFWENKC